MSGQNGSNTDLFEAYFKRADLDGDGQISGAEAVAFFQGSNLPKQVLAQVWSNADQRKAGFLNRSEFFNALKLVTVAQSKRELTPDIVKAALYGPASAKIPAPRINLAATPSAHSKMGVPALQLRGTPPSPQNMGVRGPHGPGNVSTNQQFFPSQPNQLIRPSQAIPPGTAPHPRQALSGESMHSGGTMGAPPPPVSNMSTAWHGGSTVSPLAGASSSVSSRGITPPSTQDGFGLPALSLSPSVQPRPTLTSGQTSTTAPKPQDSDSEALAVSGNGFASDLLFGDVFSATPVQPKQDAALSSAGSILSIVPGSSKPEPSVIPSPAEPLLGTFSQQPVSGQYQQGQSAGRQNQQFVAKSTPASTSTGLPIGAVSSDSTQSLVPLPKMTQSEVQKYTKVFVQVDTDRDGKITGEQARNLFLSWRLPREVLKQVWDLSDQDHDSMLSLKEFCTALYLMERYREGRPLPTQLPSTITPDEALFSTRGHPPGLHGSATWGPAAGLQQSHGVRPPTGKPPRPVPAVHPDRTVQPTPQKPKVPELEKHLVYQLSKEEQDSLNVKLEEATEADRKVEELEKEILTSREKIQFYHAKMQELILYKSRCDSRLNEITERVSGDKREVESLAKKYEQKYKQPGDVASKLTLEEATFRDIQEKKLELYQAIVKVGGDSGDGALQQRTDHIQKELEELVKNLNDRSKEYGLRAKPTSLVELPFGWQPGIQEGTADWDEDWDELEDEGFMFVKEFTLDVQNVIAPLKQKSLLANKEMTFTNDGANASSSNTDAKSEKDVSSSNTDTKSEKDASSSNTDAKAEKDASKGEEISENELAHEQNDGGLVKGLPHSPAGSGAAENQSQEVLDSQNINDVVADVLPHGEDARSYQAGPESEFSGDKGFDEPSWGRFDSHYDTESLWGFDTDNAKGTDHDRHVESSTYGFEDFGLKPIRTESSTYNNNLFQGKTSSIFADSVPSTPAYSITNSPRRFAGGLDDYSFDKGKSPFVFADSVPSTPASNIGNSPQTFSGALEDHSFDSFSRFDSFNMHDGGLFQSPRHSFASSDFVLSTRDSDQSHGLSSRFDSSNARDGGYFQSQNSLARFDSMRSNKDFDHGPGFPTFDDTDQFGSSGPFRTGDSITQNKSSGVLAFGDTDPFGSTGPFKTSVESKTQNKSSDNWSAF